MLGKTVKGFFLKTLHSSDGVSAAILVCWGDLVDNSSHLGSITVSSDSTKHGEEPTERARCWSKGWVNTGSP